LDFDVAFKRCQDEYAGFGELLSDGNRRVNAAHIGKTKVHECHIRQVFPELVNTVLRIRCVGYQLHVCLTANHGAYPFADQGMIIDAQDTNPTFFVH
jgi:hypothetical protein